jgi:hypothetical protein
MKKRKKKKTYIQVEKIERIGLPVTLHIFIRSALGFDLGCDIGYPDSDFS